MGNSKRKKIVLLGSGYVGGTLLHAFDSAVYEVVVTTLSKEKEKSFLAVGIHAICMYGNDKKMLSSLLQDAEALVVTVAPNQFSSYQETYLETARAISDVLKERKEPLYVLYTSSTSVYGNQQGKEVDEESALLGDTENARVLIETEHIYEAMQTAEVKVCILRLAGIYGPGRTLDGRAQMMAGKKMSGADTPTNHIHLEDIVKAVLWCYEHRISGVYNLAQDAHPTKKELYDELCKRQSVPPPLWEEATDAYGRNTSCIVLNHKIKSTGFSFLHPFLTLQ